MLSETSQVEHKTAKDYLVLIVILIGIFAMYYFGNSSETPKQKPTHSAVAAFTVCQQYVQQSLKAPGSAKWPGGYSDYTQHLGGGRYRVTAWVDAQNTFGALVRTNFKCEVRWQSDDRWYLENLALSAH